MVTLDVFWRIALKYIFLSLPSVNVWCAVVWEKVFWEDVTHTFTHNSEEPRDKPKYGYNQSQV